MKRYGFIAGAGIILIVAIIISLKLSTDALAVVIGMGLGMLASVPTSLILFYFLMRPQQTNAQNQSQLSGTQQPPVIVVNGGQPQTLNSPPPGYQIQVPPARQRTFTIVGEEETEL